MRIVGRYHCHLFLGALAVGGCSTEGPSAPDPSSATAPQADAVKFWEAGASVGWNAVARGLVIKYNANAFQALRGYAILSTAQYNAAIGAEDAASGNRHPSPAAAVAGASAAALSYLFPAEAANLDALVTAQLAGAQWPGESQTDPVSGETVGRTVAAGVVARAAADHFFDPWSGTVPVGPCLWFSTANPPAPPVGALFGKARTYFLTSGDQFRPPPPPACGSAEFLAALAEVRHISDTRTPEQDSIVKFWAFPVGTYAPAGYWNDEASRLIVKYHLREREAAHVLALMNMAGFDAVVASHDAKFAYWLIRPTQADPGITLAIGLPNFPSYPSNHATVSAAQATILGAMFPSERTRLAGLAEQAAISRIYGGIHYRFDADVGLALGRRIATLALSMDIHGHEPFTLR